MENEHRRSYALIDSILTLPEKDDIDRSAPFLDEKVKVISKWRSTENDAELGITLSRAIVGTILSEGLVFNTLFSFFLYLSKKGLLPITCTTNEEVRVDENLHTHFYISLYNVLTTNGFIPRLDEDDVNEMVNDFIHVEDMATENVLGSMGEDEKSFFLIMNTSNSKLYTRIVANSILKALGYDTLFPVTKDDNPYPFVNQSLIHTLTSFFDHQVVEYGKDVDHGYEEESDLED